MFRVIFGFLVALALTSAAFAQLGRTDSRRADDAKAVREILQRVGVAYNEKKWDEVIELSTKALGEESVEGESRAQLLFMRANVLANAKKDCARAIPDFSAAIELVNTNAEYYFRRGYCLDTLKQGDHGIADMTRAIELDPNNSGYLSSRCISYFNVKNNEAALADCEAALKTAPKDPTALIGAAASSETLGRKEEALAYWTRLAEVDPANAMAKEGIARLSQKP